MKIIILGYTGLVGNGILEYLAQRTSYDLVCVGRNIINKPYRSMKIRYFKWDFVSFEKLNLFFDKNLSIVINCVGKSTNVDNNSQKINEIFVKYLIDHLNGLKSKVRLIHLSSVSVYGGAREYLGLKKFISENSPIRAKSAYSRSKFNADLYIQNNVNKRINKKLSYSILRISNIIGDKKQSNLYKFVTFSLKNNFWIRCYENTIFNFIDIKDVTKAIILIISKLKISENKLYIVSDDIDQKLIYENYQKIHKKKIINIKIPFKLVRFLTYFPMPKKLTNFISLISTRVSYNNNKIKKELNFKTRFSLSRRKI